MVSRCGFLPCDKIRCIGPREIASTFGRAYVMLYIRLLAVAFVLLMLVTVLTGCPSSSQGSAKQHRDLGAVLVEKQQYREALKEYEEAVKLDPKDDETYFQMALLYLRLGTSHDV